MVEVDLTDDFVTVRLSDYFQQPLQVTLTEALTLLAAGQSRLDTYGNRPELASALEKLAAAIGDNAIDAVSVDLGRADTEIMGILREATAVQQPVEIEYYTHSTNTTSTRTVEPHRLEGLEGKWHLFAYCRNAEGPRQFRVDRVLRATPVGEPGSFDPPDDSETTVDAATPTDSLGGGGQVIRMSVPTELMWILLNLRGLRVISEGDETVEASVVAHGDAWLDRLLLRLGTRATLVDEDGTDLAPRRSEVARRILAGYT
jgi:proteasome accessory factor C